MLFIKTLYKMVRLGIALLLAITVAFLATFTHDVISLVHTPFAMPFDETTNTFRNFDRSVVCTPQRVIVVACEADVVAAVKEASEANRTLRAVGAGHSFQPLACGDYMMNMDGLRRILFVNASHGTVVVESGIRLKTLNEALAGFGLAMPQLGLITEQSLAGAISTGTHGTGFAHASVGAMAVQSADIIAGNGSLVTLTGRRLNISLVSLGAMGIVVRYTLKCVPAHRLHQF